MKIVIHSLNSIEGIEIYPIISLIIFFTFFILVGYIVVKTPKHVADEMSQMPLDDGDFQEENEILKH